MRSLLDVNVLIALLDADHVQHESTRRWLRDNIQHGWATCPITENGCLRIMSQPAYPNPLPTHLVAERLREATATVHHKFWADTVSLLQPSVTAWRHVIGPRQVTDLYLLALAVEHGGRLATFDRRVVTAAIAGAGQQHLCVI